tara:strand:- start:74 stop:283 length:210 start_codon:yes stop_codon:yes gene_type:complete
MELKKSLAVLGVVAAVTSTPVLTNSASAAPGFHGIKKKPVSRVMKPGVRKPVIKKDFSKPRRRIVSPKG